MLIKTILMALFWVGLAASFDYCTINPQNTLCKFKPTENAPNCMKVIPLKLTPSDQSVILKTHNDFRRKVANGLESRGSPGPQPPAADMREMTWDDELATMAQTHAQQCAFKHDTNRDVARFKVGQNLAIQFSTTPFQSTNWTGMISNWYDEVATVDKAYVTRFPSNPKGVIGHYTQTVWASSYKVGCGVVSYQDTTFQPTFPYKLLYVCDYGAAGNFLDQPMYTIGKAASACGPGTVAKNGLCA